MEKSTAEFERFLETITYVENEVNDGDHEFSPSDYKFVCNMLLNYIQKKTFEKKKVLFYYDYDYQNDCSVYDYLMNRHSIAIKASSDEEATILSVVLKLIINKNFEVFGYFLKQQYKDFSDFFSKIEQSGILTTQEDNIFDELEDHTKVCELDRFFSRPLVAYFDKPIIFTKDIIIKILQNENLYKKYDESDMRFTFILQQC